LSYESRVVSALEGDQAPLAYVNRKLELAGLDIDPAECLTEDLHVGDDETALGWNLAELRDSSGVDHVDGREPVRRGIAEAWIDEPRSHRSELAHRSSVWCRHTNDRPREVCAIRLRAHVELFSAHGQLAPHEHPGLVTILGSNIERAFRDER